MKAIRREILSLAIPSIIANITTPLLGLVDLAIVGHLGSPIYIGAIALGGTIFSMIYWVFAFLRMGTSGMTAQAVGLGDREERDGCFYRAMVVAMTTGIVLIALQRPLLNLMLGFMGSDEATSAQAAIYFKILIYGAPATMGLYVANGWFIGIQNSRLSMWTSLIINLVNIGASLLLVYAAKMKVEGVASGTLIAQWTGFGSALLMCRRYRPSIKNIKNIFDYKKLRRFLSINNDIFWRTLCLVAVTVWFTRAGARQGELILAANALLMQFFILDSYIMDGFAFAGEAIVGKLTGEGDRRRKVRTIKCLFRLGAAISLLFTAVYAVSNEAIMSLLSDDASVIDAAREFKWWTLTIPFAGMSAFIWDGVFIGETRTRQMLISMATAMAAFFAVYFALSAWWGNHALWFAFVLYLAIRGILQTIMYRSRE